MAAMRMAIEELSEAIASGDEVTILAKTNLAGSALYSLWSLLGVSGLRQVEWAADDAERQNIVGLVYARGEAEHRGRHVAMAVGYGEAPYGRGPYGGGWLWRECATERPQYEQSQSLYESQVLWEPLVNPMVRAEQWFATHLLLRTE